MRLWRSAAGAPQPWLYDDTCTLPRRKRSHHQYATREALSAGAPGLQSALSPRECNPGTPPPRAGRRANAARAPRPQTNTDRPERANGPKRNRARRFGCAVAVSALQAPTVAPRRTNVIVNGGRTATPLGRTKTLAGKEKIVASVQEDIEGADLIYSFEGSGMGIKVIDDLRDRLPEASKARIVKTTLFKRGLAAAGYGDDVVSQVPALSNMWVFSTTDDMKATVKAFDGWVKDNGLEKPIKGGYFDNDFIDAKGVKKVKDLPTMPDLMLKLCVSLNLAGSLGIAKAVKAAKGNPRQVAVAISKIEELPKTD